jgi:cytochrome c oxidase assembly protein subunit 15
MNQQEWENEFENYKKFPEWQQRQNMTLDEFKYIFFWEYGHRMMGRGIGLAYTLPLAYFAGQRMIPSRLYPRIGTMLCLGGASSIFSFSIT